MGSMAWQWVTLAKSLFWLAAMVAFHVSAADPKSFAFGECESVIDGLSLPTAVVFQSNDRLVVAEAGSHSIRILGLDGRTIRRWGKYGDRPGCFRAPMGLAMVGAEIWVADSGNHRIQVFSAKGKLRRVLGAKGTGPGRFLWPNGLAFDEARQRVAVADSGNARIQILRVVDGEPILTIDKGSDGLPFLNPAAVAFDADGNLYVVDRDKNTIDRFDAEGQPREGWGGYGPYFGLLDEPTAAVWQGQRLWVVDRRNHRLQAFSPESGAVTLWGLHEIVPHEGGGKLHYPDLLAIAPDGKRAAVGESLEHRIQVFSAAEEDLLVRDMPPNAGLRDRTHFGSYLGQAGQLLVAAEPENHYVFVFDLRRDLPVIINKFGERGTGFGLINRTAGLCILPDRKEIWVLDSVNRRLGVYQLDYDPEAPLRFDPNRVQFALALDDRLFEQELESGLPVDLRSLKLGPDGQVYVLDGANGAIFKVVPATMAISVFFSDPGSTLKMLDPVDFTFDSSGSRLWIVDRLAATIQVIGSDGQWLGKLGRRGSKRGRLLRPFGIAASEDGGFFLTDSLREVVMRFDHRGKLKDEWGGRGVRMGQFWQPQGVATDQQGRVIVIDRGNHRAQIFSRKGEWLATFGAGRAYTKRNVPPEKRPLPRR